MYAPGETVKKRISHKWLQTALKTVLVSIITQIELTNAKYQPIPEDKRPIRHILFSYRHQRIQFKKKKKIEHRSLILAPQLILSSEVSHNAGDLANAMWLPIFFAATSKAPFTVPAQTKGI